jgi:hypothetical protein
MVSIGTPKPVEMPRNPSDSVSSLWQARASHSNEADARYPASGIPLVRKEVGKTIKRWRLDGTSYTVREDKDNG